MENDKPNIEEELNHIRDSINKKKNEKEMVNENDNFILLDKIVSRSDKKVSKILNNKKSKKKDTSIMNKKILESEEIKSVLKGSSFNKTTNNKKLTSSKKSKDPVAALVEREIKPIIKKWISKNLKSFVKTIVIEEMKLISKATEKHK
tara:strand:+ start:85 stop:528 length:444 start_codon:yes stop_codon:yes gene_type:complete